MAMSSCSATTAAINKTASATQTLCEKQTEHSSWRNKTMTTTETIFRILIEAIIVPWNGWHYLVAAERRSPSKALSLYSCFNHRWITCTDTATPTVAELAPTKSKLVLLIKRLVELFTIATRNRCHAHAKRQTRAVKDCKFAKHIPFRCYVQNCQMINAIWLRRGVQAKSESADPYLQSNGNNHVDSFYTA